MEDMAALFGGLRFRMGALRARNRRVEFILGECAETLETLGLYPSDPYGEEFFE